VRVLTVSEKFNDYGESIASRLADEGFRVESAFGSDTLGKKIKMARPDRIPYLVIIGEKEAEAGQISIRDRNGKQANAVEPAVFIAHLHREIDDKVVAPDFVQE